MQEVVTFRTVDTAGADVYHTNVMMAIGTDVAVVCAEAVPDDKQRKHLLERLSKHHKVHLPLLRMPNRGSCCMQLKQAVR